MHKNIKDLSGKRFGRLVVISYSSSKKRKNSHTTLWNCLCDCGNTTIVARGCLTEGHTKSCGCLFKKSGGDASTRKGKIRCAEYSAWRGMINRCENKKEKSYFNYGGRGITICKRWRESYALFLSDVGRKPAKNYSIDRIDVNGHYEPGNVRWATAKDQVANRRNFKRRGWRESAKHAYGVVKCFEDVLSSYTGSRYAITCDSCTDAIYLAVAWQLKLKGVNWPLKVEIPNRTYCSVPMAIKRAGCDVVFRKEDWLGSYQLKPFPIWDNARHFTSGMYLPGSFMCVSFHWSKHLPIGRGGAILCDDKAAADWFTRMRFDGRAPGIAPRLDKGLIVGIHSYMTPDRAANGLMLMSSIKEHNEPLPNDDYPELDKMEIFK